MMDFDIDIERIKDKTRWEFYREAFARLEDHEAEIMAELGIRISREGKVAWLTKLWNSRLQDLASISAVENIDRDFSHGWFSNPIGIQMGKPFTRALSILICELTSEWLAMKIQEVKGEVSGKPSSSNIYNNSETVLIFYFGMVALGVSPRKTESVAKFARFLHALTGKDLGGLDNSDFYDKLKTAPLVIKDPKRLLQYLQNVRKVFERNGFKEALGAIDKEIHQTELDIEESLPGKRLK